MKPAPFAYHRAHSALLMFDDDRLAAIFAGAAVTVGATFESARVAALPLEGCACLAEWDDRDDQLVMHVSTQVPHQVRSGNPLGVMGAGEGGVNAVGAAVANAVRDALGLVGGVGQLLLTPARVRRLADTSALAKAATP